MFAGQSLRVAERGDGIAELCFDRSGEKINKLDIHAQRLVRIGPGHHVVDGNSQDRAGQAGQKRHESEGG